MLEPMFAELAEEIAACAPVKWLTGQLFVASLGPQDAPHRVWWDSGTHGQESSTPLGLLRFCRRHGTEWPWEGVGLRAVVADAQGLDELGYGFVGVDKSRSCWPPMWGYRLDDDRYWTYVDNNSAWGNVAQSHLPEVHSKLRQAMHDWEPTLVYASHETDNHERRRHPFWVGAGLMIIETYPIKPGTLLQLEGIPNPAASPVGFIAYLARRWGWLFGLPRWKRNARILQDNPHWQLVGRVADHYDGRMLGEPWMKYMEMIGYLTVGPGRMLHSRSLAASEWLTVTDYATTHFGCPGITTEAFPPGEIGMLGLDCRASETELFATAIVEALA